MRNYGDGHKRAEARAKKYGRIVVCRGCHVREGYVSFGGLCVRCLAQPLMEEQRARLNSILERGGADPL